MGGAGNSTASRVLERTERSRYVCRVFGYDGYHEDQPCSDLIVLVLFF